MTTPERAARKVLEDVGWNGSLPVNPEIIAKCYDIDVIEEDFLSMGSSSGRCVITEDNEKVILVNPVDPPSRRRFTVAHELGHALLHTVGVHERSSESFTKSNYKLHEVQANRFAAELLMPVDFVTEAFRRGEDLEMLTARFGVSPTAMRIRLEKLGLV